MEREEGSGDRRVTLQVDQLRDMADRYPDQVAYRVIGEGEMTFAEWERQSNRLARGLAKIGVGRGDRVALQLEGANAERWVVAYAAVHKAGAAVVPLDPRLADPEVDRMLARARVVVLLADGDRALRPFPTTSGSTGAPGKAEENGASDDSVWWSSPEPFTVIDADRQRASDGTGGPDGPGAGRQTPGAGAARARQSSRDLKRLGWDDVLDDDGSAHQVAVQGDDLSDVLFTSGTTGMPKGVVVCHDNASAVPNGSPSWTGGSWLHASPLATFAGVSFVFSPMKMGMSSTYLPRFDADRWFTAVEDLRPTAVFLVPAMVQLLLGHPRFAGADLSSIGICSVGSAPLAPAAVDRLQSAMPGALVSNNYGMTEAGSVYCLMPKGEATRRPGSVGRPLPPAQVRCVGDDGEEVAAGTYGSIELHIPGRQRRYLDDAQATAETWVDGWLRTGDIGMLDEDGYLYIGGRAKDVIIRGGSNIYSVDVENVILAYPGIAEAAVVGVPHEVLGEDIVAVVVNRPGTEPDIESLRRHCLASLAAYKVPRRWEIAEELPRNPAGKVLKDRLREGLTQAEGFTQPSRGTARPPEGSPDVEPPPVGD
ncbi:MAG: class I adenylate-forming enzyme family protein [Acidimicrobiales bacterium]